MNGAAVLNLEPGTLVLGVPDQDLLGEFHSILIHRRIQPEDAILQILIIGHQSRVGKLKVCLRIREQHEIKQVVHSVPPDHWHSESAPADEALRVPPP